MNAHSSLIICEIIYKQMRQHTISFSKWWSQNTKETKHKYETSYHPSQEISCILWYLASRFTYEELKFPTGISPEALSFISPQNSPTSANVVCKMFKEYFIGKEQLPWKESRT